MLVSMAALILDIVGVVLVLFIVVYGIYITFYPLTKTVKGGSDAVKERAEKEKKEVTAKQHTHPPPGQAVGKGTGERSKKGTAQKDKEM